MKKKNICPKCQEEVPAGSLYCPKCLTEIQWVKEYDSVEALLEDIKFDNEATDSYVQDGNRKKRIPRGFIFLSMLVSVILIGGIVFYSNSYSYLISKGNKEFLRENYKDALTYTTKALEKNPYDVEGNLLLIDIFEKRSEINSAILVMKTMLSQYPDDEIIFKRFLDLLLCKGDMTGIKEAIDNCTNESIKQNCQEYICNIPTVSLRSGIYMANEKVELHADEAEIYYTLDGSSPKENGTLYTKEIILPEGSTVLTAIAKNQKGVYSEQVVEIYTVSVGTPESAEIYPESGKYDKATYISLTIPEGCKAVYAFDKLPTVHSTEYTVPIVMPQGKHNFYVLVVAANGKVSKVAHKEYDLEY